MQKIHKFEDQDTFAIFHDIDGRVICKTNKNVMRGIMFFPYSVIDKDDIKFLEDKENIKYAISLANQALNSSDVEIENRALIKLAEIIKKHL